MIDTIALALGHGLIAIALLRLVMRNELDIDPELQSQAEKRRAEREASSISGRNSRRRDAPLHGEDGA